MTPAAVLLLLAKATLVLVGALALARVLQRAPAGARHLVWLGALGALLVVPALAAWGPLRFAVLPRVAVPDVRVSAASGVPAPWTPPAPLPPPTAPATASAPAAPPAGMARLGAPAISAPAALLGLWAAVALGIGASLASSWLAVRRIVRRAQPLDGADWLTPLYEVADRLELDEPPRLLRTVEARMPFACGLRRATIVLPAESDSWTPDRRRAVLLHELAHVRRRDLAGHTLARVVCAVYWFHPLVWTAARRLRAESERACDDLALASGARAADYAEHLLEIVTAVRRDATPLVALAMARRTEFEGRVLDILDPERPRAAPSRRQSLALVAALALITVVVGAAAPAPAASSTATTAAAAPAEDQTPEPLATPTPAQHAPSANGGSRSTSPQGGRLTLTTPDGRTAVIEAPSGGPAGRDTGDTGSTAGPAAEPTVGAGVGGGSQAGASAAASVQSIARAAAKAAFRNFNFDLTGQGPRAQRGQPASERVPLLVRVLRTDTSANLRRIAAWGLAEFAEQPAGSGALAVALRTDADPAVREMAAWALADADHSDAARAALAAAVRADAADRVRATAAWALGNLGDRGSVDALTAALGDRSPEVRARAAWALGNVGARPAPRALVALLSDGDPQVRKLAAWALFNIEDPAAVPALQAALRAERDPELQAAYIRALAAVVDESVDALRTLLDSPDPKVKAAAVRALAGGQAAGPWPWPWPEPRPFP